ncbi:peptide/nickel transport system ATP-binding protein/peptide/nickel transport system ATP-binding protein [Saccharopolyspora erythraea NRRL 2338]|uniref:ABC transporter ATP-binding protein n=2 Tax=Saccharopolyspora erythraea TaxID=1836 RepID=A4FBS7_SACEN|nr:ABC transporter ATP-binding protein [Saccharopolyspora erythraea]EQD87540.1 peptide ABC transporter ATPase [Saccharopolyspora erythraea D]PFG95280.1 peptide/nickel transport system ATP-binding protein/peptide/nickel transport system ATP-binding protein [Saccharopolyspora erythraea NRRL 2338]QRK91929.1 ABC transporter ATP-binding protein [Saccharopolyspora erythraea]CAM01502.1 putative ABC transporter ATP-binding protein [Saccharopolyspora erythraea NRRL 2338]
MSPILQLRDTSVSYRTADGLVPAVQGVDLSLDAGDTLGLAGESGCGKTTLAMSVLRLLPKSAEIGGEVLLDGKDVRTMSFGELRAARWASASVVFQGAMHALNPVQSIGTQIAEPIRLHSPGRSKAELRGRVAELLEQVELPAARADAYPHELSGGQKQRVMIAMALACEPRLVIADEPTTALDVVVQAQILELMGRLVTEREIALMMISHDLSVLSASCARLAVMYGGRLVEEGPSQQVITAPRHEHSRALASAFPTVGDPEFRFTGSAATGSALLAAKGVSVDFTDRAGKRVRAVRGVDLEVADNEIVALVGQSGSGKTTLARTMLGLQAPTGGAVHYDGSRLPTSAAGLRDYRRHVQLVLQDPTGALNPRHTVYEAVAEGLRIHGIEGDERELVAQALEAAELRPAEKFFSRLPHELSGGQRQRVVIAGALVLQPRVLVADEPVASLDATVRGEILALLLRLRVERGLSTLVITHDLGLAWNIADRVAVMYQGEIVEVGDVEQVLLDPEHEYTRTLLSAVPAIRREAAG